jgi:hypothetical protein
MFVSYCGKQLFAHRWYRLLSQNKTWCAIIFYFFPNIRKATKDHHFYPKTLFALLIAFLRSIPFPKTPLIDHLLPFKRSIVLKILKSFIFKPGLTSSQCKGMDTVAPILAAKSKGLLWWLLAYSAKSPNTFYPFWLLPSVREKCNLVSAHAPG